MGSQTAYTRTFACGFFARISFCTQLAPARQTAQVGDSRRTSRVDPESWLKRSARVFTEERVRSVVGGPDSFTAYPHDTSTTTSIATAALMTVVTAPPRPGSGPILLRVRGECYRVRSL